LRLIAATATVVIFSCAGIGAARTVTGRRASSFPHLDAVTEQLNARAPYTDTAGIWKLTYENTLPQGWLLQTPDCWGRDSCARAEVRTFKPMLERMRAIVGGAQRSVDIANLGKPNGRFLDAILEGLRDGVEHGHRPFVRILIGTSIDKNDIDYDQAEEFLQQFEKRFTQLSGHSYRLPTEVAFDTPTIESWEHSKALIADGRVAMLGGMNYWSSDYLEEANPVNDVSMIVEGQAAAAAHRFENVIWGWACKHRGFRGGVDFARAPSGQPCVADSEVLPASTSGEVAVLTVGRLGEGIPVPALGPGYSNGESPPIEAPPFDLQCPLASTVYSATNYSRSYEYRNPGEIALRALIMSAHRSVFLSQQDLLSCGPVKLGVHLSIEAFLDSRVFTALAQKIFERVPVTIVLSSAHSTVDESEGPSGDGYSNNYSPDSVERYLRLFVRYQHHVSDTQATAMVCSDVGLATVRSISAAKWPNGKPFANHAKVVEVDGAAFYVGSENLYPARLQELGFIVEDQAAAATLRHQYLEPLWRQSEPDAIIDPATGRCREHDREYSSGWEAAFQSDAHHLTVIGAQDFRGDTGYKMAPATSASLAIYPGNRWKAAFQADSGSLWVVGPEGWSGDTHDRLAPGTSPSVAGTQRGAWKAAFQADDHRLWVAGNPASLGDIGYGMAPDTSPSIAVPPTAQRDEWVVAYQNERHHLAVAETKGGGIHDVHTYEYSRDEMAPDTSPSVALVPGHGWEAAFRSSSGHLMILNTFRIAFGKVDTGYAVAARTSPSITTTPNGGWRVAFQSTSGRLSVVGSEGSPYEAPVKMTAGSSPTITAMPGGSWEAAFAQEGTNHLWVVGTRVDPGDMGFVLDHSPGPIGQVAAPSVGP
jgi:phosphatidylserine/phosphatidylglycerophosphate/cardiolipin synthase-like enzyme